MKKIAVSLLFALLTFGAVLSGMTDIIDKSIEDFFYHNPVGVSEKIRIIKIDERSISELGAYESWDRDMYARLVETLCVSENVKPAVIGFDILFSSEYGNEADRHFAQVCEEQGNVLCAFSYVFEREAVTDEQGNLIVSSLAVQETVNPYPELYNATRHGFANALQDADDGVIRSSMLYFPLDSTADSGREYSFDSEIYRMYCEAEGRQSLLPERSVITFRYSGGIGDYENVSFSDVINGNVPAEAFDDCIVLVGAYAAGMMDAYYVPVDRSTQMYGVEIHANVIEALLEEKYITFVPPWLSALAAAIIVGLACFLCGRLSVAKAIVICLAIAALSFAAGYMSFNTGGFSGNITVLPVGAVCVGVYHTAAHYYTANRAKRQIENAFKKYVAPQVVSEIAKSGNYELKLGGENRDIAVLFVDIRGFTPLSESLEPEQVVNILNSYLKHTASCIFRHGGTLDKFIGDAAMAVFNAPFDTEDYVYKAVATAWDIAQGAETIEKEFVGQYGKKVGFGVGVNCGPAVVGNIGSDFRMDYTAIGDTVNTAARLEANAPAGTVYISDSVYERIKDRITVEEVGEIPLKGKSKGVFVYSVKGLDKREEQE
ncbi:MAG: adenylate/guanylate cyclase domain-containing protein [Oscillospiraceae bacterium]|nr:adenylate/guanylate cyclase domain-containing protein [Oscillospiraceae bacterium]